MAKKRRKQMGDAGRKADKYELYLASVQAPDVDVEFFERVYKKEYKQPPQPTARRFLRHGSGLLRVGEGAAQGPRHRRRLRLRP